MFAGRGRRRALCHRDDVVGGQPRQLPALTLSGMRDKGVGDTHVAYLANDARVGEELGDAAPRATRYSVFLQGNQQIMLLQQIC